MVALLGTWTLIPANFIITIDHKIFVFRYLQDYGYDIYFTTIVYVVSRKLIMVMEGMKYYKLLWYSVHGALVFFTLFLTVSFVVRTVLRIQDCSEIWFFILNVIEILLSVAISVTGRWHDKLQQ